MPFKNGHVLEFTATFHSYRVDHSSNPKGGASTLLPQLQGPVLLTAAPAPFTSPVSATFRKLLHAARSLRLEERFRGGARSTPMVEAEPHVSTCEFSVFSG